MIVSNESAAVCPLTLTLAPGTCQNPTLGSTLWNSRSPENNWLFVPPRKSSEPVEASLKPKTDCETAFCLVAVLKNGSCLRLEIAGNANPRSYKLCKHSQRAPHEDTHPIDGVLTERGRYSSGGREDLISDLNACNRNGLGEDGAFDGTAISILDLEVSFLLFTTRGLGRIELVLLGAGGICAINARHPQVGRTS